MALLKSTNVIGNLSATGNIIASKFILNGGDNNSLLLAGGNTKLISDFATSAQMTAANTSINNLSNGKVGKAGDTMTGPLINNHVSTTWINSCNGKSAYNVGYGSYTGWINGYTKEGRMAISTYPGNDNKLYFIYMKNDTITAGTNSTNAAMTWDGSTNTLTATTFTGALNGNANTATQWYTSRTFTIGATGKTVNGTANVAWTPYEMRVTRAQYNVGSNMNQIADHGCELGMANLQGTNTTINPNGETSWHHYINMTWSDTKDNNNTTNNEWCTQIANKAGTTDLWVRSRGGGSITDGSAWAAPWTRILTGSNWTSVVDGRYLKLDGGGTMTGTPVIKFPASAGTIATSDPMAITYGRISAYGTLCINADSDGSTTEHLILTAGRGLSGNTADGLAIGYSTLTWQGKTVLNTSTGGTANYIPKFTATNTLENSSITDNGTIISFATKLKQGSPTNHNSIANMNCFKASLFVEGDDSAPIYPKTPGFYLGRSQSDENRHMDIVTGAQFAYIDFNSHVMAGDPTRENTLDYSARFIVDVYTGLTKLTWGDIELPSSTILPGGKIDKRFHIDGNASVAGNLSAVNGLDWNNATWQPQGNIVLTPNGNDAEWSFDIKDSSTSYTNAMWHVWSEKAGSSLLQCIASPSYKVNIPHGNLGLGSANFQYNTSDKCIDVKFN